jgi:flagellar motor component MotA
MNIFLESFGPLDEKYTIEGKMKINPFKKTTPITAIMKIWFSNRNKIDSKQMVKVFKKLLGHSKTNELLSLSGMSACKYAHLQILNILNENANIKFKE